MYRVWNFITNYSILLISGAIIALIWANINPNSYHHFVEFPLWFNDHIGLDYGYWAKSFGTGYADFDGAGSLKVLSLHYLVNDMLMAFFFAIAATREEGGNPPIRHARRHARSGFSLFGIGSIYGLRHL
jgi:NhaA family Na+:H+ antiporter